MALLFAAAVLNSFLHLIQRGVAAARGKGETSGRALWSGALILEPKVVDLFALNSIRLWLSSAILAAWPNTTDTIAQVKFSFWTNVTLAALFGPVSRMLLMYAVRYVTAGMCTLLMLVAPSSALVLGVVVLHQLPASYELGGAAIMLA